MREVHLFPGRARTAQIRAVALAAHRLPPAECDHLVTRAAESHAGLARTFGDDEAVIAADAAGYRRAVQDECGRLHVQAVIDNPEELQAAREVFSTLFAGMTT